MRAVNPYCKSYCSLTCILGISLSKCLNESHVLWETVMFFISISIAEPYHCKRMIATKKAALDRMNFVLTRCILLSWYKKRYCGCNDDVIPLQDVLWIERICVMDWTIWHCVCFSGGWLRIIMITPGHRNTFHITRTLRGNQPLTDWFLSQNAGELWCFLCVSLEQAGKLPVILDAVTLLWGHCNNMCYMPHYRVDMKTLVPEAGISGLDK